MNQTRFESMVESMVNISSGFVISLLVWIFIVQPLYGISLPFVSNLGITGIFTISAIIRSYFWRRFFNNGLHKILQKYK